MNTIKQLIKAVIPRKLYLYLYELKFSKFNKLSTQEIFTRTYKENIWGGENGEFNSGGGTTSATSQKYINMLSQFIKEKGLERILDIGCGDFRIMGQVIKSLDNNFDYTGVDIVKELVAYNNEKHGSQNVRFVCLDASKEVLPDADLVTIRQILQHLSNAQIISILKKLSKYKYVFITELLPNSNAAVPNLDKLAGPHDRTGFNSGVYIDLPPFNMKNSHVFLEYPYNEDTILRTYLITNDAATISAI